MSSLRVSIQPPDTRQPLRHIKYHDTQTGKTFSPQAKNFTISAQTAANLLSPSTAGRVVPQVNQTTPIHKVILWHPRKSRQKPDMYCQLSIRTRGHILRSVSTSRPFSTQFYRFLSPTLFENSTIETDTMGDDCITEEFMISLM